MRTPPIRWSELELAFIKVRREWPRRDLHEAFCRTFGRTDVTFAALNSLCKRNGWLTGRDGRYEPGRPSPTKGTKVDPHPNSIPHQFRPAQKPANALPLWSERIHVSGYVEIKVPMPNPYTGHATRFVFKHRYLWEQANGPLPPGMTLKSRDGNRLNTDPANWFPIPRAMLARLGGKSGRDYDNAPPELKPTILATATLEQLAHDIRKERANG